MKKPLIMKERTLTPTATLAEPPTPQLTTKQPAIEAVKPSEVDPLRCEVWNHLKPEEKQDLRAKLLVLLANSLTNASVLELQAIAQFADLFENDCGFITPAEAFITTLVTRHYQYGGLTPGTALKELEGEEGFQHNFNCAIERAERFKAMYSAR